MNNAKRTTEQLAEMKMIEIELANQLADLVGQKVFLLGVGDTSVADKVQIEICAAQKKLNELIAASL